MSRVQPADVYSDTFSVNTQGRSFVDISDRVRNVLADSSMHAGVAHVFLHHTSCSLLLGENADPTVRDDLERFFSRLVTDGDPLFKHTDEGADDMPAHIRSILAGVSVSIPLAGGELALGTWQGLYLWEHRQASHRRRVSVTVIGH